MPLPTFLIADDSDAKQMMLRGFLLHAKWKGDIVLAHTTDEAIAMIKKYPDMRFAFVDYEMPTENGPAVIAALKQAHPSAHIALVTSADLARYESEGRAAGAEAFICTTRQSDEVEHAIMSLIDQWRG